MTQLVLNNVTLPQTSRDKYRCYEDVLATSLEMASGRMVREIRGVVYKIEYAYDYMGTELLNELLGVLRSGAPVTVQFLPDTGTALQTGMFWVQSITQPTFAFSRNGTPYWHNVAFSLREVEPHA